MKNARYLAFPAWPLIMSIFVALTAVSPIGMLEAATPTLSITDDDYGQAANDFSVPVGTTLTNAVTWSATDLEGRGGSLFLRFDTTSTVELLPADLTVTFGTSTVPAIKVGFSSMEYNPVANIPNLGIGGTNLLFRHLQQRAAIEQLSSRNYSFWAAFRIVQ